MLENIPHLQKFASLRCASERQNSLQQLRVCRAAQCRHVLTALYSWRSREQIRGKKTLDSRGPWRKFQGLTELQGGVAVEQLPCASGGCQSWSHGQQQGWCVCHCWLCVTRMSEETIPPGSPSPAWGASGVIQSPSMSDPQKSSALLPPEQREQVGVILAGWRIRDLLWLPQWELLVCVWYAGVEGHLWAGSVP